MNPWMVDASMDSFFSLSSVLCNSVPSNPFFSGIFPYVGKFPLKFCEGRRVSSVVENSETLLCITTKELAGEEFN